MSQIWAFSVAVLLSTAIASAFSPTLRGSGTASKSMQLSRKTSRVEERRFHNHFESKSKRLGVPSLGAKRVLQSGGGRGRDGDGDRSSNNQSSDAMNTSNDNYKASHYDSRGLNGEVHDADSRSDAMNPNNDKCCSGQYSYAMNPNDCEESKMGGTMLPRAGL